MTEFIEDLQVLLTNIPDDNKSKATIDFNSGDGYVECDIYYPREEYNEEYEARMVTDKILKETKERDELELYHRLHEKFGTDE